MARVSSAAVALAVLAGSSASAQSVSLDARSLRLGAGIVRPEALHDTAWLSVAVTGRLFGLPLEPEIGFWSSSETAFGLRNSVRDLHAGLNLTWSPLGRGRARLLAAAGGSAHVVTDSGGSLAGARVSETSVRPALQLWLATEVRVSPRTVVFAAFRSDWILRGEVEDERETRLYAGIRLAF